MLNDLRYALRMFHRNPGFAAAAVASIGLAIGANAAIFSLSDALFLRPLDVPAPARLVTVGTRPWASDGLQSFPDYTDFREATRSFENVAAVRIVRAGVAQDATSPADLRMGFAVSANFMQTFGVRPDIGRDFESADDRAPRGNAVLLLGRDYWMRAFGGDPSIVGRTVRLNGRTFDVVGIVPDAFSRVFDVARPAFFVPLTAAPALDGDADNRQLTERQRRFLTVKGRLKDGVSIEAASAEADTIFRRLADRYPDSNRTVGGIVVSELQSRLAGNPYTPQLLALLALLTLVLLCIACGNVANLVLSRAAARTREIGVRLALGASRWRLVRQLMVENVVLALTGGAVGTLVAMGAIGLLTHFAPPSGADVPVPLDMVLDARGLLLTFTVAAGSAVIFGLLPALRAGRTDVLPALKPGAGEHGRERRLTRSALVVVQVAGSVVLLVAASQMGRGFAYILGQDPGFSTDRRLTMRLDPLLSGYTPERAIEFYRTLRDRAAATPGVRSVTLASGLPTTMSGFSILAVAPEGFTFPPGQDRARIVSASADERYFETVGVRLVQGRGFGPADTADAPRVVVVDESFAARYLGPNPVGQRLRLVDLNLTAEVVGVFEASRHNSIFMPAQPFIYVPLAQQPVPQLTLVAQTLGDPAAMADPLRRVVQSIDPSVPVFRVETTRELFETRSAAVARLITGIAGSVGLVGMCMALLGLYAMVAYQVSRRTREIGIRMALGAAQSTVLRMILGRAAAIGSAGVAVGAAITFAGGRGLTLALGAPGLDPVLFALVAIALLGTTVLAAALPARRAASIDPQQALRQD
ncbi:MAG TPA: ABC transporter permease [Vicinamibacterales bacterium]|jgi:predicted permease|nr:ABC transporter permease [Vicinamibacterales bacterium]